MKMYPVGLAFVLALGIVGCGGESSDNQVNVASADSQSLSDQDYSFTLDCGEQTRETCTEQAKAFEGILGTKVHTRMTADQLNFPANCSITPISLGDGFIGKTETMTIRNIAQLETMQDRARANGMRLVVCPI